MKEHEKLKLIDGTFNSIEAKEILTNIFSSKAQFHTTKNFSSQIRFGKDDEISAKRIPELKKTMEKIFEIILEAEKNNQTIKIHSEVSISLIDNIK